MNNKEVFSSDEFEAECLRGTSTKRPEKYSRKQWRLLGKALRWAHNKYLSGKTQDKK